MNFQSLDLTTLSHIFICNLEDGALWNDVKGKEEKKVLPADLIVSVKCFIVIQFAFTIELFRVFALLEN